MQLLKDRILKDGIVKPGNILKVDSFLNHQMDITLINEIGKEFKRRFADCPITKILTIEASGIGIACIAAQYFDVPVPPERTGEGMSSKSEVLSVLESQKGSYISGKRLPGAWHLPRRSLESDWRAAGGGLPNNGGHPKRLPARKRERSSLCRSGAPFPAP